MRNRVSQKRHPSQDDKAPDHATNRGNQRSHDERPDQMAVFKLYVNEEIHRREIPVLVWVAILFHRISQLGKDFHVALINVGEQTRVEDLLRRAKREHSLL